MNKVLKLQRVGLITPTVVEYEGRVLATNHLDVESTCNLWRVHFGFYPTEKVDIAMTKKQFSSIQQKTLSSVKSVYELFYERNFIPREFEANEGHTEWGMYRNKELEKLEAENAALRERLDKAIEPPCKIGDTVYKIVSCCYDCKDDWGDGCRCKNLHKSKIVEMKVNSIRFDKDGYVLSEDSAGSAGSLSLNCYEMDFGKDWFLTPEAAEARLKELQGD